MKIYLGGPINGCTDDEANGWRDKFRSLVPGHEFIDPMVRDYRGVEDQKFEEIVELDKKDISNSDLVLAYAWQVSWGTAMELHYAHQIRVPSIVVLPADTRISPWVRYHATAIVNSLEEAAEGIGRL